MLKRYLLPALVLALMVWNVAVLRSRAGHNTRLAVETAWSLPFPGAQGAVRTVLSPGGRPVVVVQTPRDVALVTLAGRLARSREVPGLVALATGDLGGDGGDEVVLLLRDPPRLEALNEDLKTTWSTPLALASPTRVQVADLNGDGYGEVFAGGPRGIEAFTPAGRALWTYRFPLPAMGDQGELRGLDGVRGAGLLAAARRDGMLAVLDAAGHARLERKGNEVRRLRAGDADGDGREEVLIGYDSGTYEALDAAGGRVRLSWSLGEAVVELRAVNLDGRRETAEIALGGKRGAVSVLLGDRQELWAPLGVRVSELAGVDTDGDGRDELVVGGDDGQVTVFAANAVRLASFRVAGKPDRIVAAGEPGGPREILVAGGQALAAYRLSKVTAPAWYSPLTAGVLGVLGVVAVGWVARRLRPLPRVVAAGELTAAAGRAAQAQLQALIAAGHVSPAQAVERLAQLERQAAHAGAAAEPAAAPPPPPPPRSSPPPPRRR